MLALDDASFTSAVAARDVLYNLLVLKVKNIQSRQVFRVRKSESFQPTAEMLTVVDVNPNAVEGEIPPFYNAQPFEVAIAHAHGEVAFTTDNKVLYFMDRTCEDRCETLKLIDLLSDTDPLSDSLIRQVIRTEVRPNHIDVGQVAQVTVCFRVLQQLAGDSIFWEMLKTISILDDGISMVNHHSRCEGRRILIRTEPGTCAESQRKV